MDRTSAYAAADRHRAARAVGALNNSVDPVNDCDSATNPNFLGEHAGGLLYIDRAGESFSLLSLEAKNDELPFLWSVASSKGGVFESSLIFTTIPFVGDLWTDVQWITLSLGFIDECFHTTVVGTICGSTCKP